MKKVRMAIVGAGHRGAYIASLFNAHPHCQITAIMDRHLSVAQAAATKLGLADVKLFNDFDELLLDGSFDAVFFGSNPMEQVAMACRAMEKGRHVCTEVPAAFTLDECWTLVKTVEKTGCKYQLMEQTRYWGFVQTWAQRHAAGEFGHLCMAQGEYIHYEPTWHFWHDPVTGEQFNTIDPPPGKIVQPTWRQLCFANPIYYLPHTLSPLLSIIGGRVTRVSCMGTKPGSYIHPGSQTPIRDLEYALMQTDNDTLLAVGAGFTMPHVPRGELSAHWYELRGNKASVSSPRFKDDSYRRWSLGEKTYTAEPLSAKPLEADEKQANTGHGGADFKPVDTFVNAILQDTTPPLNVYLTAELTAPAVLAAESSRSGGTLIHVPDFRPKSRRS